MLIDMYPLAVQNGIPSDEYWGLTLEEILIQVEANQKIREADVKQQAHMDYRMAQLVTFAFNDPEKLPKFELAYPFANDEQGLSPEEKALVEMQKEQALMIKTAEQIKATRARKQK